MKTDLKFGLSQSKQYAPKWLINTTSVIALFVSARHYLINEFPGLDEQSRLLFSNWADYLLTVLQVLLALAVIFTGTQKHNYD